MAQSRSTEEAVSRQSFEEEIARHLPILRRVAYARSSNEAAAEDLVQETLLRATAAYDRLRPGTSMRAWLVRILKNASVSRARRGVLERRLFSKGYCEGKAPWLVEGVADPRSEPTLVPRPLSPVVQGALSQLTEPHLECVLLVDFENHSYKEAAAVIGRPVGTVMSRLHRGRRTLRGLLRGYAEDQGIIAKAA